MNFNPLAEMTEALYDEVMNVNVKGLYFSIQRLVPLMKLWADPERAFFCGCFYASR